MTDTDDAQELRDLAQQAFDTNDFEEAARLYRQLVEPVHPGLTTSDEHEVRIQLGVTYVALNERDLALDQFQKAGMDSGQYDTFLQEAAQPEDNFDLACDAYGLGDYQNAINLFTLVLTNSELAADRKRDAHWNLAMCFVHLGDRDKALDIFRQGGFPEEEYTKAISGAFAPEGPPPSTFDPDQELSNAYDAYGTGDYSGAAGILQRLIDSPEVDTSAKRDLKWSLALCHFNLGNDDEGTRVMADGGFTDTDYEAEVRRIRAARSGTGTGATR